MANTGKRERVRLRVAAGAAAAAIAVATFLGCTTDTRIVANPAGDDAAEKCAICHAGELRNWKDAYHAKAARSPREAMSADELDSWVRDGAGNAGPTTGNIDGQRYELADVQIVVGSRWKQRYLVVNPLTGNHQFLDKQWNGYTRNWEDYGNKDDWAGTCTTCHPVGSTIALHGQTLGHTR